MSYDTPFADTSFANTTSTDPLSVDTSSARAAWLKGFADGLSDPALTDGALLDWMSTEGLLEHVTLEADCE